MTYDSLIFVIVPGIKLQLEISYLCLTIPLLLLLLVLLVIAGLLLKLTLLIKIFFVLKMVNKDISITV